MIATRNSRRTNSGKVVSTKELLVMQDHALDFNEDGSRNALFFTAALITRYNEITDKREVVVIDYYKDGTGELQVKFPGVESMMGETPLDTLVRGIKKEIAFTINVTRARLINQRQFFSRENKVLAHAKMFFTYEYRYPVGALKKQFDFLKKVVTLPGAEYSNPRWEVIDQRLLDMIFPTHQYALNALMRMR